MQTAACIGKKQNEDDVDGENQSQHPQQTAAVTRHGKPSFYKTAGKVLGEPKERQRVHPLGRQSKEVEGGAEQQHPQAGAQGGEPLRQ